MEFLISCGILLGFIAVAAYLFYQLVFTVENTNLNDDVQEVIDIVNSK